MQQYGSEWDVLKRDAQAAAASRGGFGLRPLQEEVLRNLAHGRSVFAGLPTGYGKSACYWLPAAAWGWKVFVISPLVALLEDQVLAANGLGLRTVAFRARESQLDRAATRRRLEAGDWDLCFLTPERLELWARSGYLQRLGSSGIGPELVTLDEMHCLEEWRAFRPAYGRLFERLKYWIARDCLLLGLSASMPEKDSRAWMRELCGDYAHVSVGLGRENLSLSVVGLEREDERWLLLLSALRGLASPSSALVYCGTRRETDEVARWLCSCGLPASAYHAGLPSLLRSARTEAFRKGFLRIVCATSAFGMGVDYPHVTRVIHFSMPHDLESYWQEAGRAGRSGEIAHAIAFWRRSEVTRFRSIHDPSARERFLALWRAWLRGDCRKQAVAESLGVSGERCGLCDRCLGGVLPLLEREARTPWWLEPEAHAEEWLEEKLKALPGRDATAMST